MIRGALTLLVTFALGALAAPLVANAQQPPKVPRIGVLGSGSPATQKFFIDAFGQALRELGYMDGQGAVLEYRWAEGKLDRLPELAAELVHRKVDVIVTAGEPAVRAAGRASGTTPIVVWGATDLVRAGLVASLARPGGNVTGTFDLSPELSGKRLELLKETIPRLTLLAILWSPPRVSCLILRAPLAPLGCSFSSWRCERRISFSALTRRWSGSARARWSSSGVPSRRSIEDNSWTSP